MSTNSVAPNVLKNQKGELHLFVIWEHGRRKQDEIIRDIQQHFTILDCFDIQWDRDTVVQSFRRFYGSGGFRAGLRRFRERGGGRFLLVTVWDEHPVYEIAEALSGHEVVNVNMLNRKKKYRHWTPQRKGNCIHCSTSPQEANHNLTLLLGKNVEDYLNSVKQPWNGQFKQLNQNMLGARGWKNLEEVFYALNSTVDYAVLRNFEELPSCPITELHGDIDILTADRKKILLILNSRPNSSKTAPHKVRIDHQWITWDIRHVGDNYYCKNWQEDMLKHKVFNPEGFYCLDDENHFFALVYHALVQKYEIAKDYYGKAQSLFDRLQLERPTGKNALPCDFDLYFNLLQTFMKRKGYDFVKPICPRVKYNKSVISLEHVAKELSKRYGLTGVEPIKVNQYRLEKKWLRKDCELYFQGFLQGKKLFLKTNGFVESKKSEYYCSLKCFQRNKKNFVEPVFYYDGFNRRDFRCVASEYLEGESLETLLSENRLSVSEKENIILQIKDIAQTLCDARVAHRDLHAGNLWVTPQGHVKCFDFGWAVDIDNYKECQGIRRYPLLFRRLKRLHVPGHFLRSDDVHSLLHILQAMGIEKEYEESYRHVETYLKSRLGTNAVDFKHKFSFIFYRCLRGLLRGALAVSKNVLPPGSLRATLQRGLEKNVYYID